MKWSLTSNQIKGIAIAAMTIDHLAWTLFPGYDTRWFVLLAHIIGRLTAPIMWFFLAEGYYHTRSVKRYALRLFLLAFLSHFAYNFCFGIPLIPNRIFNQTSVAWSLAWGLVMLWIFDSTDWKDWQKLLTIAFVCLITFPSDWSCVAAMAVLFLGLNRGNFKAQMAWLMIWSLVYAVVYFLFLDQVYGVIQLFTCLSIPLLRSYNGQRGHYRGMGKLFYAYYPVHLFLLGLLRIALWGAEFVTAAAN